MTGSSSMISSRDAFRGISRKYRQVGRSHKPTADTLAGFTEISVREKMSSRPRIANSRTDWDKKGRDPPFLGWRRTQARAKRAGSVQFWRRARDSNPRWEIKPI